MEQNPVRAGIVKNPRDYPWSSARGHIGTGFESVILIKESRIVDKDEWADYLKIQNIADNGDIRLSTQRGMVYAAEEFIDSLGKKSKKALACLDPGRPQIKKTNKKKGAVPS